MPAPSMHRCLHFALHLQNLSPEAESLKTPHWKSELRLPAFIRVGFGGRSEQHRWGLPFSLASASQRKQRHGASCALAPARNPCRRVARRERLPARLVQHIFDVKLGRAKRRMLAGLCPLRLLDAAIALECSRLVRALGSLLHRLFLSMEKSGSMQSSPEAGIKANHRAESGHALHRRQQRECANNGESAQT